MELTDLVYIDSTGYHFADYPTFLEWIKQKYRNIYGEDVYLEDDSQDGQFLAILAKSFYDTAALGSSIYASQSPATAQGTGLSRIVKINGLRRQIPTKSAATVSIGGTYNTVITNGVAIDELQQKWNLPASVTIPIGGTIDVTATAVDDGAINALPNTINRIFTPTLGWQTVNNAAAAVAGDPVESDAGLRVRQSQSTANPSLTVFEGTIGAVANVAGVTEIRGYENDTGSTDANGIPAHKICVVVEGGDSVEIAQTIALHKTPGTGTFGNTSETVYDSKGMPLLIAFQRPTDVTIKAQVTLSAGIGWSSDYEDLIAKAVADTIAAFGIGHTILISKLYAPAYLIGTPAGLTYDIASIEIGKDGDPLGVINVPLDFDELPECDYAVDVTIVVT